MAENVYKVLELVGINNSTSLGSARRMLISPLVPSQIVQQTTTALIPYLAELRDQAGEGQSMCSPSNRITTNC